MKEYSDAIKLTRSTSEQVKQYIAAIGEFLLLANICKHVAWTSISEGGDFLMDDEKTSSNEA